MERFIRCIQLRERERESGGGIKQDRYVFARILAVAVFAAIVIAITNAVVTAGRIDATAVDARIAVPALVDVYFAQITFKT